MPRVVRLIILGTSLFMGYQAFQSIHDIRVYHQWKLLDEQDQRRRTMGPFRLAAEQEMEDQATGGK